MADHIQVPKNHWFRNDDIPGVPGPNREIVGYGPNPPVIRWENGAKVAVNIVINYEEGSELTFAMGDGMNDGMYELPFDVEGQRDLAKESMYEYGSRAGIWRMFRTFDRLEVPVTVFGAAVALERNPEVARKMNERGDDIVGHGYRWIDHYNYSREEEKELINLAMDSFQRTLGRVPEGWYCREMSTNTRELLVEDGRFLFDSDYYGDDLPYWTFIGDKSHLVVPYSLVTNDCRYIMGTGFGSPSDFVDYAQRALDQLLDDGDDCGRMLSIGIHPRITGHPARISALTEFIRYAQSRDDVVFMRRTDIAKMFIDQVPRPSTPNERLNR
ncbi:putative xylanase/chitin deacetylase [Corynebacterium mustelae]|uniref:Putative xylanase/chitin deacetylase n=1 Tax=Corynebacterium mustelae TaxID=571915 RepID=A0A0G3GZQ3_9CORY|nr:polysaccharide deacetylase family protein [Corynebacterium mustelae]AKK05063.1 putative xylanase/chitin deacetylase [Corynebacterium mustelae]